MYARILGVVLLVAAAAMMGCTDSIIPCTTDEDCTIDWGWQDNTADHHDPGLTCTGPHPLDYCNELLSYIPPLDWLPFGIGDWIQLPDCEELYGALPEDTKTCESSWGPF